MADSIELVDTDELHGTIHRPAGSVRGGLALTHGAGGNSEAVLLKKVADAWSAAGFVVFRYDLPFRIRKPKGPPHPSKAAEDRDGVVRAAEFVRSLTSGPLVLAGHSYGGRQTSMVVAEHAVVPEGLVLFSYPLHPPGKPEKARTAHLPDIDVRTLFLHGSRDPFGTIEELSEALASMSAETELVEVTGAGHDLSAAKHDVSGRSVESAEKLFAFGRAHASDPATDRDASKCST